ncbi:hypothetical protein OHD16_20230 [Sphingobacterium sp. ML3W]|uniref:hypothetical protein n=1 Tax=Sphingobacterium sp. ML3W TaxID=1538644 RepID=UPI00249B80BF|nr:hypothetical protein [Sphingobacterium sp. ML3W]WFA82289.1 hypothetical protein OGI71_13370 [Sphingobacterium sp. ML3W]
MKTKITGRENTYLPVAWEYHEIIKEQINNKNSGKIFYFEEDKKLGEAQGSIIEITEEKNKGCFIVMKNGLRIRIDRIITLFGKIGAAHDEYSAYADACMDCTGGYSKEELEDM